MKTNFFIALILGVFVAYAGSSVSLADFVIDDFQSANPSSNVTVNSSTDSARISVNRVASSGEGYKIVYGKTSGIAADEVTASITYSFTNGLRSSFGSSTPPAALSSSVKFYIPIFIDTLSEGTFTVNVRQFFADTTFSDTAITPDGAGTTNSMLEIDTGKTIGQLGANDISSVRFDITYSVGTFTGFLDQSIILGGGSGVTPGGAIGSFTAVPEPTSAAMIGCALVGLIARRRRKA